MQPTVGIDHKCFPSSDLASLGHLSRLPARSALLPAAEASSGRPLPPREGFYIERQLDEFYFVIHATVSTCPVRGNMSKGAADCTV